MYSLDRQNDDFKSYSFHRSVDLTETLSNQLKQKEPESENPLDRLEFELLQLCDPETGLLPENITMLELNFAKQKLNSRPTSRFNTGARSINERGIQNQGPLFVNVGPFNVAGRTRAVAIDIQDENTILAGGISGGMWKSTDGGNSWNRTTALEQHPAVSSLIQDTRNDKTSEWYYSTGERRGNSASSVGAFYFGNGIYKSTDNGGSWTLISTTATAGTSGTDVITTRSTFSLIDELAIDYSNTTGTEIYAAGSSEIIRSEDGFESFDVVLGANNSGSNHTDIVITKSGKVFATIGNTSFNGAEGEQGVFESVNGISWTAIDLPDGFPTTYSRLELGIDPSDQNLIYVAGNTDLFLYNDATNTWTDLTENLDVSSDSGEGHNTQGGYDLYVTVHPDSNEVVYVGGVNLLRSLNGFNTSTDRSQIGGYRPDNNPNNFPIYPNNHPDQHDFAFYRSNARRMIAANDGGLFRTEDNLSENNDIIPVDWTSLNNGYLTTQFYQIDIDNYGLGSPLIVGGMQDNGSWISLDDEPSGDWQSVFGGDGAFSAITYNSMYVSSQRGNIGRFELMDDTFRFRGNVSPSNNDSDFLFINPYIYNPVNQDQLFVGARGKVYGTNDIRTNPSSGDWVELFGPSSFDNQFVSALAMSTETEGVLYFGTRSGRIYTIKDTRHINESTEIIELNRDGLPFGNVSGIAIDPKDASRVLLTFSNYNINSIWYSTNAGQSWTAVSGSLEENTDGSGAGPSIRDVEIMPDGSGGNYYFVGTSVGLFMTKVLNGNNTVWEQQGTNDIGNVVVSSVKARPIEGVIVAATHGNGVFRGTYQVGVNAHINYSFIDSGRTAVLRGNVSFDEETGLAYQWLKNGQIIQGANDKELTVTSGGEYQLLLGIEGVDQTGFSNSIFVDLDDTQPDVLSINRLNPIRENTSATTVVFQINFSEAVNNVNRDDFELMGVVTGQISTVEGVLNREVFNVTVNNLSGSGLLSLDLASITDIVDLSGNAFSGNILLQETFTITDITPPFATISRLMPVAENTNQNEVAFLITFTESVTDVDINDFSLVEGRENGRLINLTRVDDFSFQVTVSDIVEDGVIRLGFDNSQDIRDSEGNLFEGTILSNQTFSIKNIITSISDPSIGGKGAIIVDKNPSSGLFNIELPLGFAGNSELSVLNSSGALIKTIEIKDYSFGQSLSLDLTTYSDGVYIISVVKQSLKRSVRIIKQSSN